MRHFNPQRSTRFPVLGGLLAVVVLSVPVEAADSRNAFRRLSAPEIRARIVGKVITDESHWSDHHNRDGTLKAVDLGIAKTGTWKLVGNEMCVTRKGKVTSSECFKIWLRNSEVEYRRDGIALTEAVLRDE